MKPADTSRCVPKNSPPYVLVFAACARVRVAAVNWHPSFGRWQCVCWSMRGVYVGRTADQRGRIWRIDKTGPGDCRPTVCQSGPTSSESEEQRGLRVSATLLFEHSPTATSQAGGRHVHSCREGCIYQARAPGYCLFIFSFPEMATG